MSSSTAIIFLPSLIYLSISIYSVESYSATLYSGTHYLGRDLYVKGRYCKNIPSHFEDHIASVKVHSGCMRLYDDDYCKGRHIRLSKRSSFGSFNLRDLDFIDCVSSVGPCYDTHDHIDVDDSDIDDSDIDDEDDDYDDVKYPTYHGSSSYYSSSYSPSFPFFPSFRNN